MYIFFLLLVPGIYDIDNPGDRYGCFGDIGRNYDPASLGWEGSKDFVLGRGWETSV
jgi:hypothetical protein